MSADNAAKGEEVGGFSALANPYRSELLAHCYRMVGSIHDAEDLVQETLLRAWRGYDQFDGRSSLRTWLYRIATNTCLTAMGKSHRRVLPSGLGAGTSDSESAELTRLEDIAWLEPAPTSRIISQPADPASIVTLRDTTRLALIAAFQQLPARQRAALMLVDVVGYTPSEAADLLEVTVTTVRSLLQRARLSLAANTPVPTTSPFHRSLTRRCSNGICVRSKPLIPTPWPVSLPTTCTTRCPPCGCGSPAAARYWTITFGECSLEVGALWPSRPTATPHWLPTHRLPAGATPPMESRSSSLATA